MKRTATVIAAAAVIGLMGAGAATADHNDQHKVNTSDIRNQTVKQHDIGPGEVGLSELNRFAEGAIEQAQSTADQALAEPALPGYTVNIHYTRKDGAGLGPAIGAGEVKQLTAQCPEGLSVLGGGFNNGNTEPGSDLTVHESHPAGLAQVSDDPERWGASAWSVTFENTTETQQHASVYTICAQVG